MKATLISWTQNPIETVLSVWEQSRTTTPVRDIIDVHQLQRETVGAPSDDEMALFERIIDLQIPVAQFLNFVFALEDVPISWREQAVRHRIGVKYSDNYAVDIIPEADISFWSQTMRVKSMADFASDDEFHLPKSIADNDAAGDLYIGTMHAIEDAYRALLDMGVPMEDARNLIPLGATHSIAMSINLQSLKHIIGARGCWIAQATLWAPIIHSMVEELCAKVHPIFRKLIAPPCIKADKFAGCVFHEENIRRFDGRDPLPVCPLYATHHQQSARLSIDQITEVNVKIPEYAALWGKPDLAKTWDW